MDQRSGFGRVVLLGMLILVLAASDPASARAATGRLSSKSITPGNGDLSGDGTLSLTDLVMLRDYLLGKIPLTATQMAQADMNGDGVVDIADLVKMVSLMPPAGMVSVAAGTFTMGNSGVLDDKTYGPQSPDEQPPHQVTLSAYQIGKYDVTNGQYCAVLNWALAQGYLNNSSGGAYAGGDVYANGQGLLYVSDSWCQITYSGGAFTWKTQTGTGGQPFSMETHPVVDVTWYSSVAYCNWLSQMNGLTPCYDLSTWALTVPPPNSGGYRLPTEAEWERAAAWDGNKHWIYGFMSDTLTGKNRCNYWDGNPNYVNPLGLTNYPYTSPVGWFNGGHVSPNGNIQTVDSPSPVGCYDMSGNVWQWCQDWYHTDYTGAPADGSSWETQQSGYPYRVIRGGGWGADWADCRSAGRDHGDPDGWGVDIGFRLARTP